MFRSKLLLALVVCMFAMLMGSLALGYPNPALQNAPPGTSSSQFDIANNDPINSPAESPPIANIGSENQPQQAEQNVMTAAVSSANYFTDGNSANLKIIVNDARDPMDFCLTAGTGGYQILIKPFGAHAILLDNLRPVFLYAVHITHNRPTAPFTGEVQFVFLGNGEEDGNTLPANRVT